MNFMAIYVTHDQLPVQIATNSLNRLTFKTTQMGNLQCDRKAKFSRLKRSQDSINMAQLDAIINCTMISKILHNRFLSLNWEEFQRSFLFDERYGVCFDWEHVPVDPYFDPWIAMCKEIPKLIAEKTMTSKVIDLPVLDTNLLTTDQQKLKLMSQLIFICNSYLFNDFPNVPQKLPKNIAIPLLLLANNLGTKPSMGWAQNMCNWTLKDQTKSYLDINNIELLFNFTGTDDEQIFYLLSNLADFRIAKAVQAAFKANQVTVAFLQHNLYQMQSSYFLAYFMNGKQRTFVPSETVEHHMEEERTSFALIEPMLTQLLENEDKIADIVIECFNCMAEQMNEITSSLKHMFHRNNATFFYKTLRNYLQGFARKDVFPNGLFFEGIETTISTEGGSGGNSPSFQIFERSVGIWFDSDLENVQRVMRQGMLRSHLKLIQFMRQNSVLRTYALITRKEKVKEAYNSVIRSYVNFNSKHLYFVEHYIEKEIKKGDPTINTSMCKGTGDVCLQTIKDRYKKFDQYYIN